MPSEQATPIAQELVPTAGAAPRQFVLKNLDLLDNEGAKMLIQSCLAEFGVGVSRSNVTIIGFGRNRCGRRSRRVIFELPANSADVDDRLRLGPKKTVWNGRELTLDHWIDMARPQSSAPAPMIRPPLSFHADHFECGNADCDQLAHIDSMSICLPCTESKNVFAVTDPVLVPATVIASYLRCRTCAENHTLLHPQVDAKEVLEEQKVYRENVEAAESITTLIKSMESFPGKEMEYKSRIEDATSADLKRKLARELKTFQFGEKKQWIYLLKPSALPHQLEYLLKPSALPHQLKKEIKDALEDCHFPNTEFVAGLMRKLEDELTEITRLHTEYTKVVSAWHESRSKWQREQLGKRKADVAETIEKRFKGPSGAALPISRAPQ